MNRDDHGSNKDKTSAEHERNVSVSLDHAAIMDHRSSSATAPVVDDRKPPPFAMAAAAPPGSKSSTLSTPEGTEKPLVKRKRRSPEKPWKKPADMPKRPLSAYNLFFRDERERLLNAGSGGDKKPAAGSADSAKMIKGGKRSKKTSGIGFANLAKTIAAKWKELDSEVKAPYEKVAAQEKKVYDEAVAEWRIKQKAKKKAQAAEKKAAEESRMVAMREPPLVPNLFSSERSLGSFSDTSNPYPSEWFHTNAEGGDMSQRSASERGVPPVVDAASAEQRGYDAAAWASHHHQHQQQHHHHGQSTRHDAYYYQRYGTPEQQQHYQQRYAQHHQHLQQPHDYSRSGYNLQPNMFSYDTSSQAQHQAYREYYQGYREYYNHQQQQQAPEHATAAMHYHHRQQPHGDMRMARATEEEEEQHMPGQEVYAQDSSRDTEMAAYQQHDATAQPHEHHHNHTRAGRSASLPMVQHGTSVREEEDTALDQSFRSEPGGYIRGSASDAARRQRQLPYDPAAGTTEGSPPIDDPVNPEAAAAPVDDTFPSLTETLDDDAISFITSMKYA